MKKCFRCSDPCSSVKRQGWGQAASLIEMLDPRRLLAGGVDRLVNNNSGATGTSFFTQSEGSVVAFGNTVVVGYNDSGSNAGSANRFTGFSRSTDGGATFVDGGGLPANAIGDAGDPVLARDETTGRIYFLTLGFSSGSLQLFRSDDNGASWGAPVTATPGGSSEDRPWLAVDNFAGTGRGNVYVASRRFGSTPGLYVFRSTDGGATFGPTAGVSLAGGGVTGGNIVIGPDHSVYVFWLVPTAGTDSIVMRRSTDLGLTFGPEVTVAANLVGGTNGDLGLTGVRQGLPTPSALRSDSLPHPAINAVTGDLYVTYNSDAPGTDKADVFMVQSSNSGASWGAPVRINDDATTTDQWMPTIAVTPDGSRLGVFYYSRQDDPSGNNLLRYYGRLATISGTTVTFSPSSPVSDVTSLPEFGRDSVVNSVYMGDYNTVTATNGDFHVVWADNRDDLPGGGGRKDPSVYYDRIPLSTPPTVTFSNFIFATAPQRLTFDFSLNVSASLTLSDFVISRLPSGPNVVPASLSYSAVSDVATVNLSGILPDGNYVATVVASGVLAGTVPMTTDHTLQFFFLNGDANHDRLVNLDDFTQLAANFGLPSRTFPRGDFNYDTAVNLDDFTILASQFGKSLPQPSGLRRSGTPGADVRPLDAPALLSPARRPKYNSTFSTIRLLDQVLDG